VLEPIFTAFANAASSSLTSYLHSQIQLSLLSLEQMNYGQYSRSVPDPTVIGLFGLDSLPGKAVVEINLPIGYWMLDCLLGGTGEIIKTPRPFTDMEKGIIEGVIARMLNEFGTAWRRIASISPKLIDILDSSRSEEIADPIDTMLVGYFDVNIKSIAGMASICLPILPFGLNNIKGGRGSNQSDTEDGDNLDARSTRDILAATLEDIPVSCTVQLGTLDISPAALAGLSLGDILCLDKPVNGPLDVLVLNSPKFRGKPVLIDNKLAVEILKVSR